MNQEQRTAVSRMQTHIETHIHDSITLRDLAKASGYSPYHAARLFKEATGHTPFDYIRRLRLTKAAKTLRDSETQVLDVALDFVFDSHEGFTRAFSRTFGLAPRDYRKRPVPIPWFHPFDALASNLDQKGKKSMKTRTIFTQIIERPLRQALIKRGKTATGYFKYCEEVDPDIWGILLSVKEALYEPVGMWLPDHLIAPGTSPYVQGVEVPYDYEGGIPEGLELITLDSQTYMVFQGEPYDDSEFETFVGEVMRAIETYDPTLYGYAWDLGSAPRCQLEPQGYRGYIEMHPVKKLSKKT